MFDLLDPCCPFLEAVYAETPYTRFFSLARGCKIAIASGYTPAWGRMAENLVRLCRLCILHGGRRDSYFVCQSLE